MYACSYVIKLLSKDRERGGVENLATNFSLYIGDPDYKIWYRFLEMIPKGKTSKIIMALVRGYVEGRFEIDA